MKKLLIILSIILSYAPAVFVPLITTYNNPILLILYMISWIIYVPVVLVIIYHVERRGERKTGEK